MSNSLPFWYMNAAGWSKTVEQVRILAAVPLLTHIVVGSFTPEKREGNTGGTNFYLGSDGTSTNSIGLKNDGFDYLRAYGGKMVEIAHAAGKKLVVSIAGFSAGDYYRGIHIGINMNADAIELNAGCPNVLENGHSAIASYSRPVLEAIIKMGDGFKPDVNWWLKVSPMANPKDLEWIAATVRKTTCQALTAVNTFPNISLYHANGKPYLDVANNYGGMSGKALKPIALSNCRRYRELLPDFTLIGVGGVDSGEDIHDYLTIAKCDGVQVGCSFFASEDPRTLNNIAADYLSTFTEVA